MSIAAYVAFPDWEMLTIFLPQIVVGMGNGLLLPTARWSVAPAGGTKNLPHSCGQSVNRVRRAPNEQHTRLRRNSAFQNTL